MNREQERARELSPAEKARSAEFEKAKRGLEEKGYEAKDLTVGLVYANIMAIVLTFPIILCFGALFVICNSGRLSDMLSPDGSTLIFFLIFMAAYLALIVAHELIHGLTWALFAEKHWKSISFGYIAKYMTPYCTCRDPLKKGQYIIGALAPTIVLGVIPAAAGAVAGSVWLLAMGAIMILSGGGDLTIILGLVRFRDKGKEVLYMDHPYQAGLVAFVKAEK